MRHALAVTMLLVLGCGGSKPAPTLVVVGRTTTARLVGGGCSALLVDHRAERLDRLRATETVSLDDGEVVNVTPP